MTSNIPSGALSGSSSANTMDILESYDNYAAAQRAVDFLSDNGFPVENTSIVGTNLRLVETVTGRMTWLRAGLAGAGTGGWLGLLLGLLFTIFSDHGILRILLTAVLVGVFWGAIFGLIAYAFTGGKRDFSSVSSLEAGRYDVLINPTYLEHARQLLARLG